MGHQTAQHSHPSSQKEGMTQASTPNKSQHHALIAASPLIRRFCSRMASAASGKPILDIACGTGRNAFALAALGCNVICADKDLSRFSPPQNFPGSVTTQKLISLLKCGHSPH